MFFQNIPKNFTIATMLEKITLSTPSSIDLDLPPCAKETSTTSEKKDTLQSTSPSKHNQSFWEKISSYFSYVLSLMKQYVFCCFFDEEAELREAQIEQLDKFSNLYSSFDYNKETSDSHNAKIIKAFGDLDKTLQNHLKEEMKKIVSTHLKGYSKDQINKQINFITEKSPKLELRVNTPTPDTIFVLGEAVKTLLHNLRTQE